MEPQKQQPGHSVLLLGKCNPLASDALRVIMANTRIRSHENVRGISSHYAAVIMTPGMHAHDVPPNVRIFHLKQVGEDCTLVENGQEVCSFSITALLPKHSEWTTTADAEQFRGWAKKEPAHLRNARKKDQQQQQKRAMVLMGTPAAIKEHRQLVEAGSVLSTA